MATETTELWDHVSRALSRLGRKLRLPRLGRKLSLPRRNGHDESESGRVDTQVPELDESVLPDGDGTLTRSELAGVTGVSPEHYVHQLLQANDGQLRQRDVRDRTYLSASTTSRLLSEMEADQQIRRVSIGREKIVCLPSEAPDTRAESAT